MTVWSTFAADTDYFGRREQQAMVNYRVSDLDAMLAQLRDAGADVDDRVEEQPFGRFGWAADPEATASSSGSRLAQVVSSGSFEPRRVTIQPS